MNHQWPSWPIWGDEELTKLKNCLESRNWSRGQLIRDFEDKFSKFCGCNHTLLVNNGTTALTIALQALGIGNGDEVLVPGLTWPSTALAVLECGAKAVVVDIEPLSYAISPQSIIENISPRTKAIIAVHLFNSTADIETLLEIAKQRNIFLIEDASQVHGGLWEGKQLGTFGNIGTFSFQQKKLMTCGEGGCLITNDDSLYEQAYELRDHGMKLKESKIERYGGNNRISSFNAAILLSQLDRLPYILEKEEISGIYLTKRLEQLPGIVCLKRRKEITRQTFYSFCFKLMDNNMVIRSEKLRQQISDLLRIEFTKTYPPLDDKSFFKPHVEQRYSGLWRFADIGNCHQAYRESLRFPHQYLLSSMEQLDNIINTIQQIIFRELGTVVQRVYC